MTRKENVISMWTVVILASGASFFLILAANLDPITQKFVTLCSAATGLIFGVCSLVALGLFVVHSFTLARKEWNEGSKYGEIRLSESENRRLELTLQLNDAQLKAVGEIRARLRIIPGQKKVTYQLLLGDQVVDWDLVMLFVDGCSRTHCCPIGNFSEGSVEQNAVRTITQHLIDLGVVEEGRGNRSARIIDREGMLWALAQPIDEPEPVEPPPAIHGWNAIV